MSRAKRNFFRAWNKSFFNKYYFTRSRQGRKMLFEIQTHFHRRGEKKVLRVQGKQIKCHVFKQGRYFPSLSFVKLEIRSLPFSVV